MTQSYSAWFTSYPKTHERRGQTVEVVPRVLLDEARAEVERLREQRDRAVETRENANAVSVRVEAENRRLREALRFYAEDRPPAPHEDRGYRARVALEGDAPL